MIAALIFEVNTGVYSLNEYFVRDHEKRNLEKDL